MKLRSMIPLNTGTEDISVPPPSPLETKAESYTATLSNYTRNIDTMVALDVKEVHHQVVKPFQSTEHSKTSFKPHFTNKKRATPGPAAYDPKFDAIFKQEPQHGLPPHDSNYQPHPKCAYSTADIISMYNTSLRDFDPNNIQYPKMQELHPEIPEPPLTPSLCFTCGGKRDIFVNTSPAKHLIPIDPIDPPPPPVIDMKNRQTDREFYYPPDPNRIYHDAVRQRDQLRPKTPQVHRFDEQVARDMKPAKNARVAFIEKISKEQNDFMKHLSRKPVERKAEPSPRAKSSFAHQRSRSNMLFPDEKEIKEKEPRFPFDPIESYKKTLPRVHTTKIREPGKPMPEELFWTMGYHR